MNIDYWLDVCALACVIGAACSWKVKIFGVDINLFYAGVAFLIATLVF